MSCFSLYCSYPFQIWSYPLDCEGSGKHTKVCRGSGDAKTRGKKMGRRVIYLACKSCPESFIFFEKSEGRLLCNFCAARKKHSTNARIIVSRSWNRRGFCCCEGFFLQKGCIHEGALGCENSPGASWGKWVSLNILSTLPCPGPIAQSNHICLCMLTANSGLQIYFFNNK